MVLIMTEKDEEIIDTIKRYQNQLLLKNTPKSRKSLKKELARLTVRLNTGSF